MTCALTVEASNMSELQVMLPELNSLQLEWLNGYIELEKAIAAKQAVVEFGQSLGIAA